MEHKTYKIYDIENTPRVIQGLKVAKCMKSDSAIEDERRKENEVDILSRLEDLTISDTLFCSFCNVNFNHQSHQRQHYKLDWHRYNLKQNLAGLKYVSEDQFLSLADDVSSISGSESESEELDANSSDMSNSPGRQKENTAEKDENELNQSEKQIPNSALQASRHAKVFFENSDGNIISFYRCVLLGKKGLPDNIHDLVSLANNSLKKTTWAVIMLGGGHFAAAIFEGGKVTVHKTFHSYTVRAKQGGSQSARDGRSGGSHPKSAGASLRRYNEASFAQHVQDIMTQWSSELEACDLVLYRAVGHNRNILFGGRNALLDKTDPRLRTIPFATRRATFKELLRVHDLLSSVEMYGSAEFYKTSFPTSPRKKADNDANKSMTDSHDDGLSKVEEELSSSTERESRKKTSPSKKLIDRSKPRKSPHRPLPQIVTLLGKSSSESDIHSLDGTTMERAATEIPFNNTLVEYEDTVPLHMKSKDLRKKVRKKQKMDNIPKGPCSDMILGLRKNLKAACKLGDISLLKCSLPPIAESSLESTESGAEAVDSKLTEQQRYSVTADEMNMCLNESVDQDGNTLLHIAASRGYCEIIRMLLSAGSDPCHKNKKLQTPYVVSYNKETKNVFRQFYAEFPDKYNYRKSQIPGPLTDETEKKMLEKRRTQRKLKREREKVKKQEEEKIKKEEAEKERFLRLSDREKCALAAERRMLLNAEKNGGVLPTISRCFQCAKDITGCTPFEYNMYKFCSIECLKQHRISAKVTGKS
ncbi:ankyrin repeat and zinc finger domain-containing protein 1-like [Schistocerca piceifrons]|uniref:ankyrin repeat and zinc finger domain-containing protein 1-like n=1 Tax=Schistocerca piceifrons TaxID=274613 RepID=UPI001F5F46F7|nr:ankyrin repeat and zinc finger domain-containing protein 1-like [Schistocerca piceifrons]